MSSRLLKATPIEEPESHRRARKILGRDFLGVEAAQRRFGAYTEAQLAARREIPFTDETLKECAGKYALLAAHEMDLPTIHGHYGHLCFHDPDAPRFGTPQERRRWSFWTITDPWLLVRKDVVPNSLGKGMEDQKKNVQTVLPKDRLSFPAEFGYSALFYFLETGEKICGTHWVRFPVRSAEGDWVVAKWMMDDRLHFNDCGDAARISLASASLRVAS